jgi:hypothetical protein
MGIAARFRQDPAKYIVTAVVLLIPLALGYSVWWFVRFGPKLAQDCADTAPAEVFENVFGHPPPPGLDGSRAAGRIWPGGRDIFLRMRATNAAIHGLIQGCQRDSDAKRRIDDLSMDLRVGGDHRLPRWKERVQWDEIAHIQKPECYTFWGRSPSPSANVTLIVDRARQLVYVYLYDV